MIIYDFKDIFKEIELALSLGIVNRLYNSFTRAVSDLCYHQISLKLLQIKLLFVNIFHQILG